MTDSKRMSDAEFEAICLDQPWAVETEARRARASEKAALDALRVATNALRVANAGTGNQWAAELDQGRDVLKKAGRR